MAVSRKGGSNLSFTIFYERITRCDIFYQAKKLIALLLYGLAVKLLAKDITSIHASTKWENLNGSKRTLAEQTEQADASFSFNSIICFYKIIP